MMYRSVRLNISLRIVGNYMIVIDRSNNLDLGNRLLCENRHEDSNFVIANISNYVYWL